MGSSGRYGWKFKIDFALVNNSIVVEVKAGYWLILKAAFTSFRNHLIKEYAQLFCPKGIGW